MIPTFNLRVAKFQFDGNQYAKVLGKHINSAMRAAARAFLLEVVTRIPIRTSFLRGAFGNLEDLVGHVGVTMTGGTISPHARQFPGSSGKVGEKKKVAFFKRARNTNQLRAKEQLTLMKIHARMERILSGESVGQKANRRYEVLMNREKELAESIGEYKRLIERTDNPSKIHEYTKHMNMLRVQRAKNRELRARLAKTYNLIEKRQQNELRKLERKLKRIKDARALRDKRDKNDLKLSTIYTMFEMLRKRIRRGQTQGLGIELPADVPQEYYYPQPVGRKGRKRGVRRGNPILKTPTAGRQFATQPGAVFGDNDMAGVKSSFAGSNRTLDVSAEIARTTDIDKPKVTKGTYFSFQYFVDIRYYGPNDVIYGWLSLREASNVFRRVLTQEITKYPKILSYLRSSIAILSPGAHTAAGTSGKLITYVEDLQPMSESQTIEA